MAFWGIEVKPGKPFTHLPDIAKGRLHISQATLGTGTTEIKSVVQCNIGNKSPIFLCSLFPCQSESCQLNLEFDEADEVIFSVIGRLSVHLTGYYLPGSRHYNQDDGSESYGEDIADTETERSADSGEDEYEDSFIDDSDPELIPHSPISSGEVVEETLHERKPTNDKFRRRRLRKRYQPCQSDDDCTSEQNTFANGGTPALDSENEDRIAISSLYKSAARTRPEAEETTTDQTKLTISKEVKVDSNCTTLAERKADVLMDTDLKRLSDEHESMLYSAQVGSENIVKRKKKRKMQSKEEEHIKNGNKDDFFFGTVLKWDNAKQCEIKAEQLNQNMTLINEEDKRGGDLLHTSPPSIELVYGTTAKSRKKKKKQAKEEKGLETESNFHGNVNREDKARDGNSENINHDVLLKNEEDQKKANDEKAVLPWNSQLPSPWLDPENGSKPKRKRRKGAEDKTLEANGGDHTNVIKEDKSNQDELKSYGTKCNEPNQRQARIFDNIDDQTANENHSRKKKKKTKNKTSKDGQISA